MTQKTVFITTAIDYVNSLPHIGTAYEKIGADVLARFMRMSGRKVRLLMGNDEHSANVQKAARAQGLEPKAYCDGMRPRFEDVWRKLNVAYDDFIQTSEPRHHAAVAEFFSRVHRGVNGGKTPAGRDNIYPKDYEGWYCESCEAFYTEKDLVDGVCPNHKTKPNWLKEKNYFFRLSDYREFLLDHIERHPEFILPAKRRNEIVSFLNQGLEDISISRSTFDWGIPLPIDPKHVMYVWFDALINYVTGAGFSADEKKFAELWPADLHVVGKDITRFHAVIWPAMLKAAGLPLPRTVLGHGFVYLKGEKMSKSLGNVVTPLDILNKHPEFGADALRYYLMRTSGFGDDGDFTWEGFIERYNADLANGLGNLASRVLGMAWKYQGGAVSPKNGIDGLPLRAEAVLDEVRAHLDPWTAKDVQSHFALEKIWAYITEVDRWIDQQAPWLLAKEGRKDELSRVLFTLVGAVRQICLLVAPFLPHAAAKIWEAYGFDGDPAARSFDDLKKAGFAASLGEHRLKESRLNLFPRIEPEKDAAGASPSQQTAAKGEAKAASPAAAPEGLIDIKDFAKTDLRVAKILSAEKVEGADKLLKLRIELGAETRQIVAGIAQHYAPEALVGQSVVVVANLKPAKIRGIESHGMLLAAKDGASLRVISPAGDIASGAKVG